MADRRVWAPLALAVVLVITAAWWALALWPLPSGTADWIVRTRLACFGTTPSGLPDGGGWLLLFGQPLGMLGFLVVGWGRALRDGLAALARRAPGRVALATAALALLVGAGAAVRRVAAAGPAGALPPPAGADAESPRRDAPPPPLRLVDQDGRVRDLESLRGRPVVVTFAYAHCETVCPLIVQDVLTTARAAQPRPVVLIVSLDPWRDQPARLPAIAERWSLAADEFVLSGSVDAVREVLDAWGVGIARDPRTGEIVHGRVAWVLDAAGRVAFIGNGTPAQLSRQLARL